MARVAERNDDEERLLIKDKASRSQQAPSASPTLPPHIVPLVVLASIFFRSADPLVKKLSEGGATSYPFALTTVVAISELVKCVFCCIALPIQYYITPEGVERSQLVRFRWKESVHFIFPAACFTLANFLFFTLVEYVNPAFVHVFGNTKILATGLIFHCFGYFKVGGNIFSTLSGVQWLSLALLTLGVFFATPHLFSSGLSDVGGNFAHGLMISTVQVTVASFANVYTELLLKRDPSAPRDAQGNAVKRVNPQSIFFQNGQLYFWGAITSGLYMLAIDWAWITEKGMFHGYDRMTILAIASHVTLGLSTAFVFKFLDNIVYLFLTAACMIIVAVLSALFFDFDFGPAFGIALTLITFSIFLYNYKKFAKRYGWGGKKA